MKSVVAALNISGTGSTGSKRKKIAIKKADRGKSPDNTQANSSRHSPNVAKSAAEKDSKRLKDKKDISVEATKTATGQSLMKAMDSKRQKDKNDKSMEVTKVAGTGGAKSMDSRRQKDKNDKSMEMNSKGVGAGGQTAAKATDSKSKRQRDKIDKSVDVTKTAGAGGQQTVAKPVVKPVGDTPKPDSKRQKDKNDKSLEVTKMPAPPTAAKATETNKTAGGGGGQPAKAVVPPVAPSQSAANKPKPKTQTSVYHAPPPARPTTPEVKLAPSPASQNTAIPQLPKHHAVIPADVGKVADAPLPEAVIPTAQPVKLGGRNAEDPTQNKRKRCESKTDNTMSTRSTLTIEPTSKMNSVMTDLDDLDKVAPISDLGPWPGMIKKLLMIGKYQGDAMVSLFTEMEIVEICLAVRNVFLTQPPFLEIDPPVVICGDIHGQYNDLLRIYNQNGFPPDTNYLFLGDYVDRGNKNLETICLQFCYKVMYPNNFFLLRGNHECWNVNRIYGFLEECCRRYQSVRLWELFQDVFNCIPFSACVGGRILCMHGGLSPQLYHFEQLRQLQRPSNPDPPCIEIDLMWADPLPEINGFFPNQRGVSYKFGADVVHAYCHHFDLDLICRAHQVVQDGYEFFADRRLVTVFSAPHYCGQFDNNAATMSVDANLKCSFTVYQPVSREHQKIEKEKLEALHLHNSNESWPKKGAQPMGPAVAAVDAKKAVTPPPTPTVKSAEPAKNAKPTTKSLVDCTKSKTDKPKAN